jgi:hypothetical protein
MKLNNGKYLCPFCLSSEVCAGPHIPEHDLPAFIEYVQHLKVDYIETSLDAVREYALENSLNLDSLKEKILNRLEKRN